MRKALAVFAVFLLFSVSAFAAGNGVRYVNVPEEEQVFRLHVCGPNQGWGQFDKLHLSSGLWLKGRLTYLGTDSCNWMTFTSRYQLCTFDWCGEIHVAEWGGDYSELHEAFYLLDENWNDWVIYVDKSSGAMCPSVAQAVSVQGLIK